MGDVPLAISFPQLYNCASDKGAKVIYYLERRGDSVVWGPIFRRNLNEVEEGQLLSMMLHIANVFIPRIGKDRRIWMASADDMFLVASLYLSMTRDLEVSHTNWACL